MPLQWQDPLPDILNILLLPIFPIDPHHLLEDFQRMLEQKFLSIAQVPYHDLVVLRKDLADPFRNGFGYGWLHCGVFVDEFEHIEVGPFLEVPVIQDHVYFV